MSSIVNNAPISAQNPVPHYITVKNNATGQYEEVDSSTPLEVVLSAAAPVSGETSISFNDGAGNPVTIAQTAGVQEVYVNNMSGGASNIIELDDGAGNPVTIAHVAGVQTVSVDNFPAEQPVSLADKNVISNLDDGAGNPVSIEHSLGHQHTLLHVIDPVSGLPINVKDVNGKVRTVTTNYYTEIAMGNIPAHNNFNIHASRASVPLVKKLASNLVTPVMPRTVTPAVVTLVSTSAQDGVAGTGVQKVDIYGCDAAGNFIEEGVFLNGITPASTINTFTAVNEIKSVTCGTADNGAVGTITAKFGGVGSIIQQIDIGESRTHTAYFKMPLDKKGVVTQIFAAADDRGMVLSAECTADSYSHVLKTCFMEYKSMWMDRGATNFTFSFPVYLPAGAEFRLRWSDSQNRGIAGSADFELLIEDV